MLKRSLQSILNIIITHSLVLLQGLPGYFQTTSIVCKHFCM